MPSVGDRFRPAYLGLDRSELKRRVESAVAMLADCRACPRDCGVNRLEDHWSACKTGRHAVVASYFPHFGEEDCLRGWKGSGTIFFAHCNLRCVFCQNWDISQAVKPGPAAPGSSADETIAWRPVWQTRRSSRSRFTPQLRGQMRQSSSSASPSATLPGSSPRRQVSR